MIEIEAVVTKFIPNAMSDYYDSGDFVVYDATVLEILAPAHFRGKKLTIFHNEPVAPDSPWREINRKLRFSIEEEYLNSDNLLFDGALHHLRTSTGDEGF